jgi:ubiquinone/menaquinone biosynthesis C-methylase UbiE
LDLDGDWVRNASAELTKEIPTLSFKEGNAQSLPFADNTFDLTYCRFVLMHLSDPLRAITEMVRVTKPGGMVVAHEGIHSGIWLSPELPLFRKLLDRWMQAMKVHTQDSSVDFAFLNILVEPD